MITKKATQKVHVLARITSCMCISKRKLSMNAFFKVQLATIDLYWCVTVVRLIIKLIDYMKDDFELFILITRRLLGIY